MIRARVKLNHLLLPCILLLPGRLQAAEPLREIVFGSCLDKTEHPMLDRTLTLPMDIFLFLGDNIYADTIDMAVMRKKYDALKASRFFVGLRARAPILATWDDHDLTASAMTQRHPRGTPTPNRFRHLPKTFHEPNVGRLRIDWDMTDPRLTLQILDADGKVQIERALDAGAEAVHLEEPELCGAKRLMASHPYTQLCAVFSAPTGLRPKAQGWSVCGPTLGA